MGKSLENRVEEYGEVIGAALAHADRRVPAQWYLRGLRRKARTRWVWDASTTGDWARPRRCLRQVPAGAPSNTAGD
jgi:hypothetical protein